jgi:hypothetical protein
MDKKKERKRDPCNERVTGKVPVKRVESKSSVPIAGSSPKTVYQVKKDCSPKSSPFLRLVKKKLWINGGRKGRRMAKKYTFCRHPTFLVFVLTLVPIRGITSLERLFLINSGNSYLFPFFFSQLTAIPISGSHFRAVFLSEK